MPTHHDDDLLKDRLLDVLVELAVAMTTDPPAVSLVDSLVNRVARVIPVERVDMCVWGVVQSGPSDVTTQGQGPECTWPLTTSSGRPGRWCRSTGPGRATGLANPSVTDRCLRTWEPDAAPARPGQPELGGMFDVPLTHGGTELGMLTLHPAAVDGLSPAEAAAAWTLARVAAAYLVIIQRRLALQELSDVSQQQALHDPLTGLPNRTLTLERLHHAFERSRRTGRVAAVLYLDLDGFKIVNDTFGHATGDELLVAVTTRLTSLLRPPDTLSRLHGDEFVLLCEDLTHPGQAVQICQRLQDALEEPFDVKGALFALRASVGVVVTDADTQDPAAVLGDADLAMYEAKRRGGGQFWVHHSRHRPEQLGT